jgi:hypothetical protein
VELLDSKITVGQKKQLAERDKGTLDSEDGSIQHD